MAAVRPFLYNLFSDRDIIRLGPACLQKTFASILVAARGGHSRHIYELIGGKSPLPAITQAQALALENELGSLCSPVDTGPFRVYTGMSYWQPFIKDSVERMVKDGVKKIVALTLYPQYSRATTGAAMKRFRAAADSLGIRYSCIESWCDHPQYISALADRIRIGIAGFREKPVILFSAHSLPQKLINLGDPYLDQTLRTIRALNDNIAMDWHLSFQSGSGPVKWLGPSTETAITELGIRGVKDLLIVPISFVSDHIETLYEIDILYMGLASKLGINMQRTESLNTSPGFIHALADLVISSGSVQE